MLAPLLPAVDPRLLVGPETLDDAAALKVCDDLAICFTADFITPVVDDPGGWGRIAAANSLSDIYAMGARPLAALNLVCWPKELPLELLDEVLAGGRAAAAEAGCMVVGGHSIVDKQPKYGMAVIGTVHPDRILRNQGARPGDVLYLTKPLGTGIIATAIKADSAAGQEADAAVASMSTLNRAAAEAAIAAGVSALTDVTGFGLVGHLSEMLGRREDLGADLSLGALPLLPGLLGHIEQGRIPGGARRNRDAYSRRVRIAEDAPRELEMVLYDPQTSGGLLAAVAGENAQRFETAATQHEVAAARIGRFDDSGLINVGP